MNLCNILEFRQLSQLEAVHGNAYVDLFDSNHQTLLLQLALTLFLLGQIFPLKLHIL